MLNALSATLSVEVTSEGSKDDSILTVQSDSPAILESYLNRLSFLHATVSFSLTLGGESKTFARPGGIADLFAAISSPYQILHQPIHLRGARGSLSVELVMAFQSWSDDQFLCFINNGRAVEGGTHEKGLRNALQRIKRRLSLPETFANGALVVASLTYPDAAWSACIRSKIVNPELVKMVSQLVLDESVKWLETHPTVAEQIGQLQIFQFPQAWTV